MRKQAFLPIFLFLVIWQQGCTFDGSLTQTQFLERKQKIEQRYAEALNLYRQKMLPIGQYIVSVCGPMDAKAYIDCINSKRGAIKAISIYPENAATRDRRMVLEKQLIDKQIDRKQFRAEVEALRQLYNEARLEQDVNAGVYSGQY